MTDLEIMQRAKMYMEKLAQGIDPISDRDVPDDSVLNNVRLARCFFYVSDILGQVIANGGTVGGNSNLPSFVIDREQLNRVQIIPEPVYISRLVDNINAVVNNPQMKKLSATFITNWLLKKGLLENRMCPDGKNRRFPTREGLRIGMRTETRQGPNGEFQAIYYDASAQRFVLDNLMNMLAERSAE